MLADTKTKQIGWMVGLALAYVSLKLALPMLPIKPNLLALYISMLLLMAAAFALSRAIATLPLNWKVGLLLAAICLTVWMAGFLVGESRKGERAKEISSVAQEVGLIGFASIAGRVASLVIREGNLILPAALAMMLVDVWCVNIGGTTPGVAKKAERLFKAMTVRLPPAGAKRMPMPPLLIGFGDIFFAAFIMASLARFGFELKRAFWLAVLLTAFGLTLVALIDVPLAGLPFVAAGLLAPNIGRMRLTKDEWVATAFGIGILALILLAAWFVVRR